MTLPRMKWFGILLIKNYSSPPKYILDISWKVSFYIRNEIIFPFIYSNLLFSALLLTQVDNKKYIFYIGYVSMMTVP